MKKRKIDGRLVNKMICPICKTRFADFTEEDYTINEEGIVAKSDEAHMRRMKMFESDEERFCGGECSKIFLHEAEARQIERELGFERRMITGEW